MPKSISTRSAIFAQYEQHTHRQLDHMWHLQQEPALRTASSSRTIMIKYHITSHGETDAGLQRPLSPRNITNASVTDWCMSPHGNAGPHNQSSPNSGHKFPLARSITVHNFVTIRPEMSDISAIENLSSPKKWTNQFQDRPLRKSEQASASFPFRQFVLFWYTEESVECSKLLANSLCLLLNRTLLVSGSCLVQLGERRDLNLVLSSGDGKDSARPHDQDAKLSIRWFWITGHGQTT